MCGNIIKIVIVLVIRLTVVIQEVSALAAYHELYVFFANRCTFKNKEHSLIIISTLVCFRHSVSEQE